MFSSILKSELLKGARSSWLPMVIIFYDAILAFVTILMMYFGAESFQEGYYYNTSPYLHQFLIVSSIQLIAVILIVPVTVEITCNSDRVRYLPEQFALIPGVMPRYVLAKIADAVLVSFLIFISGLPITFLSCIYSDVSWLKIIRLAFMVLLFSFWSGTITILFHCVWKRSGGTAIASIFFQFLFIMGSVGLISLIGKYYTTSAVTHTIPSILSNFCILLMMMNPLCSYMGYYGNLTGNIGLMSRLCGQVGIDASGALFSLLFYKGSAVLLGLCGGIFLLLALWVSSRKNKQEIKFV